MAKAAKKKKAVKKAPAKKKPAKKKTPAGERKGNGNGKESPAPAPVTALGEPKPKGRPEIYTPEVANLICAEISSTSKSLRTICKQDGMPSVDTVLRWLRDDKSGFCEQYARAKEEQADMMIEEMIDIADDGSNDLMTITKGDMSYDIENKEVTSRSKLRVETRKWIAAKLKPKKYGDKLDLGFRGKDGEPVEPPALNITVAHIEVPIAEKEE